MDALTALRKYEENFTAFFGLHAGLPGCIWRTGDVTLLNTSLEDAFLNSILNISSPSGPGLEKKIHEVLHYFRNEVKLPFTWRVGITTPAHEEVKKILIGAGLSEGYVSPVMVLPLKGTRHFYDGPLSGDSALVDTPSKLTQWLVPYEIGFDCTGASLALARKVIERHHTESSVTYKHFIVTLQDQPVSCSSLLICDETAAIYNVTTIPEARGHGFGRTATVAAIAHAQELGHGELLLSATASGRSMYEKLGFSQVGHLYQYYYPA